MHEQIHGTTAVRAAAVMLALGLACTPEDGEETPSTSAVSLTNATTDESTTSVDPTTDATPATTGTTTTTSTTMPPPDPDTSGDPPPPPIECDETPMGGEIALIDDLEIEEGAMEADGNILPNDGRIGFWFTYNDATAGGMQDPGTPFVPDPSGAGGSEYSARTWGSGFTEWGAGMAVSINNDFDGNCPYDATAYEGISFWARGPGTVRFHLAIEATVPMESGGICTGTCYDNYGLSVDLTDEWSFYTVTWAELAQEGWGDAADFDAGTLMEIHWQTPPSVDFDFAIDDLSFWPDESGGGSSGTGGGSSTG